MLDSIHIERTDSISSVLISDSIAALELNNVSNFERFEGIARNLQFSNQIEIFASLGFLFLLFCFIIVRYSSIFLEKIKILYSKKNSNSRDLISNANKSQYNLLIFIFSIASLSLSAHLLICHFSEKCSLINLAYYIGLFLSFLFIKYILFRIVGFTFLNKQRTNEYIQVYFALINSIAVLFFLTSIIFVFQAESWRNILLIIYLSIIGVHFLILMFKLSQLFLNKAISLFYIFLYLCTLEILPVMVFVYFVEEFLILV